MRRQGRRHCRGELQRLLPNPNALVAVSKGMRAVKLCTNKIRQFLTGGAGWRRLTCIMTVIVVAAAVPRHEDVGLHTWRVVERTRMSHASLLYCVIYATSGYLINVGESTTITTNRTPQFTAVLSAFAICQQFRTESLHTVSQSLLFIPTTK